MKGSATYIDMRKSLSLESRKILIDRKHAIGDRSKASFQSALNKLLGIWHL
jgi:hypothetical protein